MDDITRFNQARWDDLSGAQVEYARPLLHLDAAAARHLIDPQGILGDVAGQQVLCLASGGGQQSVAFALLGAVVTVVDFSATQLAHDRTALAHYGLDARLIQADMRDLALFTAGTFDVIWHAFSINFVPDVQPVFAAVQRVLRPGGRYRLEWHNPFTVYLDETWNGQGYLLRGHYADAEIVLEDHTWRFEDPSGTPRQIAGPREFNHTLSTVLNSLIARGFLLLGVWEERSQQPTADPGTWEHQKAVAPPWLTLWATYRPDLRYNTPQESA